MCSSSKKRLGEVIAKYRNRRDATQQDLADNVGVNRRMVVDWESGKSEPKAGNFIKILDYLEIDLETFIEEYKDE